MKHDKVEDKPFYPTKPVKVEDITQEEIIKRNQQRRKEIIAEIKRLTKKLKVLSK